LQPVTIERLPYQDFISRYDRPHTLFYLDPPYYGCEDYHGRGLFSREDFGTLAEQLTGITGKFILSINDTPETRKIFERFEQRGVPTKYSVGGGGKQKAVTELLISNCTLPSV
jgi:DNA adenine methylase